MKEHLEDKHLSRFLEAEDLGDTSMKADPASSVDEEENSGSHWCSLGFDEI